MLIVGLTGGIASGKSETAKIFMKLGARVIDADAISRDVMRPHTECWQKVTAAFGREILTKDLTIDRATLAKIVFADQDKRLLLNSLVHPVILHTIGEVLDRIKKEDSGAMVIIDAALLVETGIHKRCEKLVVISADEETQIVRLRERDGMPREEAQMRIAAQLPLSEKVKVADYIITNVHSLETLFKETEIVFQSLKAFHDSKTL